MLCPADRLLDHHPRRAGDDLVLVLGFDACFGTAFTVIEIGAVIVFGCNACPALEACRHSRRKKSPAQDRLEYALSSLGIIDLLAFLAAAIALIADSRSTLVLLGVTAVPSWCVISPAMRSLLAPFMRSGERCSAAS